VVQELHASLEETGKQTFGVITFYSAQRIAIWEAMLAAGLAVRAGDQHGLNPSIDWLFDERGLPRVRIGSVDAFQGREFDVVFLSTTRSQPITSNRRAHFGFLSLPNRLCVAMSRQRSLLVAVGDADMVNSPAGRDAVPALAQFLDMTGGDLGFRRTVP
jgi:superfamily I DNA and/or RNA helicase